MLMKVDQNYFAGVWLSGQATVTYYQEPMRLGAVRWFTAQPTQITPREGFADDQVVAITDVYHIMKGNSHTWDGSGGAGNLQVNVTFQTRSGLTTELQRIHVFMAETL